MDRQFDKARITHLSLFQGNTFMTYHPRLRISVRKKAKIKNPYNQIPHLAKDTILESDENTRKHHIQESQEVSLFPAGDHKAAKNRRDNMPRETNNKKKIHKRSVFLEWSVKLPEGFPCLLVPLTNSQIRSLT